MYDKPYHDCNKAVVQVEPAFALQAAIAQGLRTAINLGSSFDTSRPGSDPSWILGSYCFLGNKFSSRSYFPPILEAICFEYASKARSLI
jgi:hypothetical protein